MRVFSAIHPRPGAAASSPQRGEGRGEGRLDVILLVILLLGLWLRWGLNGTWRLSPDEALYSTWARNIASGADPWLAHTTGVDKPPLLMYAIAGAMNVYGYHEFASRFPGIIAGDISILLTYALALRLYQRRDIARLAALLLALSPFAILYAPTAYADPVMVMWLLLAAALAAHDHWGWAGVASALAVLTKQEAPLLLPVVVLLGLLSTKLCTDEGTESRAALMRGVVGRLVSLVTGLVVVTGGVEWLWEAMRPGQPSPFALGLTNYGGIGLVAPGDILPRLAGWWDEALRYVFGAPLLDVTLLVGAAVLLWRAGHNARPTMGAGRRRTGSPPGPPRMGGAEAVTPPELGVGGPLAAADVALMAAIGYTVLARTVVSFQLWDRYMLPVAPLLCILLARVIDGGWQAALSKLEAWHRPTAQPSSPLQGERAGVRVGFLIRLVPLLLVALLLAAPVGDALAGRITVGSDHGLYWGIEQTARYVQDNVPPGSVIYHHSLGWQLGYYLYGVHMDFWWYPSLEWLAQTAASRSEHSQYVIVPSWEASEQMAAALAERGLVLLPMHSARRPDGSISFETYRIAPGG